MEEKKVKIIDLFMPNIGESITVKIVGPITVMGKKTKKFVCPVRIFGNREVSRYIFRMEITKTFWKSLREELLGLQEMGDESCKMDENLECMNGRIITISGIQDEFRSYSDKHPKIFSTNIRDDLLEIERNGSTEEVMNSWNNELDKNKECITRNIESVMEQNRIQQNRKNGIRKVSESKDGSKGTIFFSKGDE